MVVLGLLACLIFGFGLLSRRLDGTVVSAPMVFVGAGLVAMWTGLVDFGSATHVEPETSREVVFLVAELALVLLLFADAASIDPRHLRGNPLPVRLLGIGLPLTIGLGAVLALVVLTELEPWECAIVAAVLAPTDAALGQAVVSNPRVPVRVRQALNVEAGLNDGLSVPFLALFLTLAVAEEELQPAGYWIRFALEQVGLGALVGIGVGLVGGWLVRRASRKGWMAGPFQRLALLALALIAWALADQVGGNGFIAAFVGGLAAGPTVERVGGYLIRFTEAEGQLLNLSVFFVFGVLVVGLMGSFTWELALYALLSLTLIRMLPVALSLIGTHLRSISVLFMGWFGPRGLASIVLGLIVVAEAPLLAGREEVEQVVALTVLFSVLLHGLTSAPLSAAYARRVDGMSAEAPEMRGAAEETTRMGRVKSRISEKPGATW